MNKLDYYLSYLYPVTIETTRSDWNPTLEIVLQGGKYSLNSENTNYSYGSLYSLFKRIFRKLKLNWGNVNNVLILGFGTGCVARIINRNNPDCIIDGVEIDNKVIELGNKYFHTDTLKNVSIHCLSADNFVRNCNKKYDLIIIDVYLDIDVPPELETEEFLIRVRDALNRGGLLVFNKFIYSKTTKTQVERLKELYSKIFRDIDVITVMLTGKIFIAKN